MSVHKSELTADLPARKLDATIKKAILDSVLDATFGKRLKALVEDENTLGTEIIKRALGDDYARFSRCPENWFRHTSNVDFDAAGKRGWLHYDGTYFLTDKVLGKSGYFVVPDNFGALNRPIERNEPLCDLILDHLAATEKFIEEREELKAQITAILNASTTVRKLVESWPAVRKYLPKSAFGPLTVSGLPAVLIEAVDNKIAALVVA